MAKGDCERVVRVEGPGFTAGLVLRDGVCVKAAPVVTWTAGLKSGALWIMFGRYGWRAEIVR